MSSLFSLLGSWTASPVTGSPSSDPDIPAVIDESLELSRKLYADYELTTDAPLSVGFGGLTGANVVIIKIPGQKAVVRLTSAEGSQQAIPVDELLIVISASVAFTAIDLTRVAGVSTSAKVFLGQYA